MISLSESQSNDSLTMAVVVERFKRVAPGIKRSKVRPTAKYVSMGLQEFFLEHDGSLWRIKRYKRGRLAPECQGGWMSIVEAERTLIAYLRRTDKFGLAIYPGCPLEKKVRDAQSNSE